MRKYDLSFTLILILACLFAYGAVLIPALGDALNVLACATSLLLFVVIVALVERDHGRVETKHGI